MPKAFLTLLLKGGSNNVKESRQDLIVKPQEESNKSQKGGSYNNAPGGYRNPKVSTTLYTRDLDFETVEPRGIQIMFMAEEELDKISVANIRRDDKEERRGEFPGTIADKRMYPHGNLPCSSCGLPRVFCPGHFGKFTPIRPIINIWAYKYVVSVLESICHKCGSVLMNLETAKHYSKGVERLKKIADASRTLTCRIPSCENYESVNPVFVKKMDNMLKIQLRYPNNKVGYISSLKILSLFKSLTTEELEALGFPQNTRYSVHPKNMLFTRIVVLPENHRPNSIVNGETQTNALTATYHRAIAINNTLLNGIKDDKMNLEELENQICSIHFRDVVPSKSGNPNVIDTSKNINEILSKKGGLIRSNAQAKRCDHTARTVLSPGGPTVRFGHLRLPEAMNKILVDERICDKNLEHFENELQMGRISTIVTRDSRVNALKRRADFVLKKGMVVKRPLQTGDPVIFNRNPTLHKHSMMGYIAQMAPGLTIGLHSSCTTPHNAD